jgi:hypothetical protein
MTEIAAIAGQKILLHGLGSIMFFIVKGGVNNGATINA